MQNHEKMAQALLDWKTGQLSQETQAKLMQIQAGAMAGNRGGGVGGEPNANKRAGEGVQNRGVETPLNVIQRATANLGGGAPSLPEAPKL